MTEDQDGRSDLVKRDDDGLMPKQRELLEALAENPDWRAAADALGLQPRRVGRWLREDPAFMSHYTAIFKASTEVAKLRVEGATEEAAETLVDLLESWKSVEFKCEHCGKKNEVSVENSSIRAKAAELILKTGGVLVDRRETKVTGEILHLNFTQKIALAQLQNGDPISEQTLREFRRLGIVDASGNLIGSEPAMQRPDDDNVIEGDE